ncbi:MAG: hypothetical protein GYB31_08820 [Bacteroidetes bacterium]|nr:hypothetical protein [Bacteroidota bacterium]
MNVKKMLFVLLTCSFAAISTNAQEEKGDFTISAGIGLVPTYLADQAVTNVLPVSAMLDYRLTDMFSLSAYGGYTSATSQEQILADGILVEYQSDLLVVGLRGLAHKEFTERLDFYGGLMLSYAMPTVTEIQLGENAGPPTEVGPSPDKPYKYKKPTAKFLPSGFVGVSWYATTKFAVYGEIGYGISLLNAGVRIRL